MNMLPRILGVALLALAAGPALAGECPAGQAGDNPLTGAPTAPAKVTDTVIGSIDLAKEIGVDGRLLRTRKLVIEPGGIVPLHSHTGRPALIYTLQGTILEHRSTCKAPVTHKAGDIVAETMGTTHWWKNESKGTVILLSSDVFQGK